jgi:hypothetical protein
MRSRKSSRFTRKLSDIVQIPVCSNLVPRGSGVTTIRKTVFTCLYMRTNLLKIFFRTSWPFQSNLVYKSSFGEGNSSFFSQIKGHVFKGEIITKCKNRFGSFKFLFFENHWSRKANILFMKAVWPSTTNSNLIKLWFLDVGLDLHRDKILFYRCLWLKMLFLQN